MKKILLAIFIIIILFLAVRDTFSKGNGNVIWSEGDKKIIKVKDGNVNCYISGWRIIEAISCVRNDNPTLLEK